MKSQSSYLCRGLFPLLLALAGAGSTATAALDATFTSPADVPVTASNYAASGAANIQLQFVPQPGTKLTLVKVTGAGFITGKFENLIHGQTVPLEFAGKTYHFVASFYGGTGNDLVLYWVGARSFAWGSNANGRLGIGSTTQQNAPVPITATGALAGKTIVSLASGSSHSLALCSDGTLAAWGLNSNGQLGINSTTQRLDPVAVNGFGALIGKTVVAIAAGGTHSLALCSDGTLAAWGLNSNGQLGDNTTTRRTTPVAVHTFGVLAGKNVCAIAAGDAHSLALCTDKVTGAVSVAAWGRNTDGQLGDNSVTQRILPVAVNTASGLSTLFGKTVSAIAAGGSHSLALCEDDTLHAWGANSNGELGDNSTAQRNVPVNITGSGALTDPGTGNPRAVTAIAAGASHSLALCSDGTLAAWGLNSGGQLGERFTYLADTANHTVRKIDSAGLVTTLAGSAGSSGSTNGTGSAARFNSPAGVAVDGSGNVYVADSGNHTIRKITPAGVVSTLAGSAGNSGNANGTGSGSRFNNPTGLVVDATGNLYVADTNNHTIRRVTPTGVVSTIAGTAGSSGSVNGTGTGARFNNPRSVTIDASGNLYVADTNNHTVRKITPAGAVSTLAGTAGTSGSADGSTGAARFYNPRGVTVDSSGNVYVADTNNHTIRKVTSAGLVTTLAGAAGTSGSTDGLLADSRFSSPGRLAVDASGNLYVADTGNHTTRLISPAGVVSTLAGTAGSSGTSDGTGSAARFSSPAALMVDDGPVDGGSQLPVSVNTASGSSQLFGKAVIDIAAGASHSLAVCSDGSLASWGLNTNGQLGADPLTVPRSGLPVAVDRAALETDEVFSGVFRGSMAIHSLATVAGPPEIVVEQPAGTLLVDGGSTIAFGNRGIQAADSLATWGANGSGQLGDGTSAQRSLAVPASLGSLAGKKVVASAFGKLHSLALCSDNSLHAWGDNTYGQLALDPGATTASATAVEITTSGALAGKTVKAIAAGELHSLALCTDGTLFAWGFNEKGQIGADPLSTPQSYQPVNITGTGALAGQTVTAIAAGLAHNLALCTDNSTSAVSVAAWGLNDAGQAGIDPASATQTHLSVAIPSSSSSALFGKTPVAVAAGGAHSLALCSDGSVAAWGLNATGQLGVDPLAKPASYLPVTVNASSNSALSAKKVVQIAAGGSHSLARFSNGTVAAWGDNTFGQIGDNTLLQRNMPVAVSGGALAGRAAVAIAGGAFHSLVHCSDGTLATWGDNTYGQIGDQTATLRNLPVAINSFGVLSGKALSATGTGPSSNHSSAFCTAGAVKVFTIRNTGTSGDLTGLAAVVDGTNAADFILGSLGANSLPPGASTTFTLTFRPQSSGNRAAALHLSNNDADEGPFDLALTGTGIDVDAPFTSAASVPVTAFSFNASGKTLALNLEFAPSPGTVLTVVRVSGPSWITGEFSGLAQGQEVALEYAGLTYHFVANYFGGNGNDLVLVWKGAQPFAWGANANGQAGDGTMTPRSTPVPVTATGVLAGKTVLATAGGYAHSLALCSDGTVAAWGSGHSGQVGERYAYVANTNSHTVVRVSASGVVTAFAGISGSPGSEDGPGATARFRNPAGVAVDALGNVYVADTGNHTIRKITPAGVVSTLAGTPLTSGSDDSGLDANGLPKVPRFYSPVRIAVDAGGNVIVADSLNHTIRRVTPAGVVSTLAGTALATGNTDATGAAARFNTPAGVAVDAGGNIYVADSGNHRIRKVTSAGVVTTFAGSSSGNLNGTGIAARFNIPRDVAVEPDANILSPSGHIYVADWGNNAVRKITPAGVVTTLATGFNQPTGVSVDASGFLSVSGQLVSTGYVYVADTANNLIRRITPAGAVSTLASGAFSSPAAVAIDLGTTIPVPVNATATKSAIAGKRVVAITAGNGHSLALCADGTLSSWGENVKGQLGNNDAPNPSILPLDITNSGSLSGRQVRAIASGSSHNLAICADGTLHAWGDNSRGQLGTGSSAQQALPVNITGSGYLANKTVLAITAGAFHSLALCSDNTTGLITVAAWGDNLNGQLGNHPATTPQSNLPMAVDASSASSALFQQKVAAIASGSSHNLALCEDGSLVAWGLNFNGQIGDGSTIQRNLPVNVTNSGYLAGKTVVSVSAGLGHSLAYCSDASIAAWGRNQSGQLGIGSTTQSNLPAVVTPGAGMSSGQGFGAVSIGGAASHTLALVGSTPEIDVEQPEGAALVDDDAGAFPIDFGILAQSGGSEVKTFTIRNTGTGALSGLVLSIDGTNPGDFSHGVPGATALAPGASTTFTVTFDPAGEGTRSAMLHIASNDADESSFDIALTGTGTSLEAVFTSVTSVPVTATDYDASGKTVDLSLQYAPDPGTTLTVIRLSGAGVITGQFSNLADGQDVTLKYNNVPYHFLVNYHGGNGNDLVLTWRDSRAFTWGRNANGQLGDNSTDRRATPVAVALGTLNGKIVVATAAGTAHSLALTSDGILSAWGLNSNGQVGDNSTTQRSLPVLVNTSSGTSALFGKTVTAIAAGNAHSLALCSDGTLAAWGLNSNGRLGDNSDTQRNAAVNITSSGVLSGKTVIAIAAGGSHSLALCFDPADPDTRILATWGLNSNGQLGDNTTTERRTPVAVNNLGVLAGRRVIAIAAGNTHSLALCSDGTVAAWGLNSNGQLGDNTTTQRNVPVAVNTSSTSALNGKTVTRIAAGSAHSLAVCSDGSVAAWGLNSNGQLGNGSTTQSNLPAAVVRSTGALAGKAAVAVAAGASHSLAVCSDGSIAAWGLNSNGRLGDNTATQRVSPVAVHTTSGISALAGKTVFAAAGGGSHSLAVCSDGSIAAWGLNSNNQLGDGTTTERRAPMGVGSALTGKTVIATAFGESHSLALCSDGTLAVWGQNSYGQLGDNTTSQRNTAIAINSFGVLSNKRVIAIAAGFYHSLALCSDGTVAAWGRNVYGQLGDNSTSQRNAPVAVIRSAGISALAGKTVIAVAAGGEHSLALCSDGSLVSWGFNSTGQLGDNSTTTRLLPVAVYSPALLANKVVTDLAVGFYHNLALCSDGTVAAWGANIFGQLGDLTRTQRLTPVNITNNGYLSGKTVTAIAAGASHSLARLSDGTVAAWGNNTSGQLGDRNGRVYVADTVNNRVRRMTAGGVVSSVVSGTTPVTVTNARDLAVDSVGNVYVTDSPNNAVRRVTLTGAVSSWGTGLSNPHGVALDETRNFMYAANTGNHTIFRRALSTSGAMSLWSGGSGSTGTADGALTTARYNGPRDVVVDSAGNVYVADTNNHTIRKITYATSQVSTLAGSATNAGSTDGTGNAARFHNPSGLALDEAAGVLYVADANNHTIRRITNLSSSNQGIVTTLAGSPGVSGSADAPSGPGTNARFHNPLTVAVAIEPDYNADPSDNARYIYVADSFNHTIRRITPPPFGDVVSPAAEVITLAGLAGSLGIVDAAGWAARFDSPIGVAVDALAADDHSPVPIKANTTSGVSALSGKTVLGIAAGGAHSLALDTTLPTAMRVSSWGNNPDSQLGNGNTTLRIVPTLVGRGAIPSNDYVSAVGSGTNANHSLCLSATSLPEIAVEQPSGTDLVDGQSIVTFSTLSGGEGTTKTFTIRNTGTAPLTGLSLSRYGANYGDFTLSTLASTTLASGATADFTVTFNPSASGSRVATIHIASNDADENPFEISLLGDGVPDLVATFAKDTGTPPRVLPILTVPGFDATGRTITFAPLAFAPIPGTALTVVNNTGSGPIVGQFANLAQGQTVTLEYGGTLYNFVATYFGGDGNDLVLYWKGSSRVFSWGINSNGQLGDNSTSQRNQPVLVWNTGVLANRSIIATAVGNHSLALGSDGRVAGWGLNSNGQIGDGSTSQRNTPVNVTGGALNNQLVTAIAAGLSYSLALRSDGKVAGWGYNNVGQIGDGTTTNRTSPILAATGALAYDKFIAISAGTNHSLALGADGTVTGWGSDLYGQTGERFAYVADAANHVIRKINSSGVVTTFAGSAGSTGTTDGQGIAARFNTPTDVAVDAAGNVYVADSGNHTIRRITPAGTVTTWAGAGASAGNTNATGGSARFNTPTGLAIDSAGNLYVADTGNHLIRRISTGQVVTTLAGTAGTIGYLNATGTGARFASPRGITVDAAGSFIYVADSGNHSIRRVTAGGVVTTWAGNAPVDPQTDPHTLGSSGTTDGTGTAARFFNPTDLAIDAAGNVYVADTNNHTIRRITSAQAVTTLAGTAGSAGTEDGTGTAARFSSPAGIAVDAAGMLTVADTGNHTIRKINSTGLVTTAQGVAGTSGSTDQRGIAARFNSPAGMTAEPDYSTVTALDDKTVVSIVAGGSHSLALCSDGTLAAWGLNTSGQLGDGSLTQQNLPVNITSSGSLSGKTVIAIAAGAAHSLALCSDHSLHAWGLNTDGQLGNGSLTQQNLPVEITGGGSLAGKRVIAIGAGANHSLALCDDNTNQNLHAWGRNANGQVGDNTTAAKTLPVKVTTANRATDEIFIVPLSRGPASNHTLALVAGSPQIGIDPPSGSRIVDGNGSYGFGESPLGAAIKRTFIIRNIGTSADLAGLSVSIDGVHAGDYSPGSLVESTLIPGGSVAFTVVFTPSAEGLRVARLRVASNDGEENPMDIGLTGTGTREFHATLASAPAFFDKSAAPLTVGGLSASGTAISFSLQFHPQPGSNLTVVNNTGPDFISGQFNGLAHGQEISLTTANGTVYDYIANYYGGNGNDLVLVWKGLRATSWGSNANGQLGLGTASGDVSLPTPVTATGVLSGKTIFALASGSSHSLALCSDGTLAAWGRNTNGQLGDGTVVQRNIPVDISSKGVLAGKRVVSIAAGRDHSFALCSDGTLAAWGRNTNGQLGDGTNTQQSLPVLIHAGALTGKSVSAIAAGDSHSLALCSDGTVAAWGLNTSGQIGDNTTTERTLPVAVAGPVLAGKTVFAIAAGSFHNLALCEEPSGAITLASWGRNTNGQLGDGSTTSRYVPVNISTFGYLSGRSVADISAGATHSLAVSLDTAGLATAASWGSNTYGQLGDNSNSQRTTPVAVTADRFLAGKRVSTVIAGDSHSLALCAEIDPSTNQDTGPRFLASWGRNQFGQLGDGSITNRITAVEAARDLLGSSVRFSAAGSGATANHGLASAAGAPIGIQHEASVLADGVSVIDFGSILWGTSTNPNDHEFTITNRGPVSVTGVTVTVEGADNANFSVSGPAQTTLAPFGSPGASAVFTITFTPSSPGQKSVTLEIVSEENKIPFRVALTGTGDFDLDGTFNSADDVIATVPSYDADGKMIDVSLNFLPQPGTALTVVRNTGLLPIAGQFLNLPHGSTISLPFEGQTYSFVANYFGGSGNDLVLVWKGSRAIAWGANDAGQLGDNSTDSLRAFPLPVTSSGALSGKTVLAIASGGSHSLAICSDGAATPALNVVTWGQNSSGQLGERHTYVADTNNHTIRKINSAGVVTTFAGSPGLTGDANGSGGGARFNHPSAVALGLSGSLYVADTANHTIRKISPSGEVTTLAGSAGVSGKTDGPGSTARFRNPRGIAVDAAGNVYVADTDNHTIRMINPAGQVSTLAGTAGTSGGINGTGAAARFNYPRGISVDVDGNVYVADTNSHTIRKITPAAVVTTLAGSSASSGSADGTGAAARFSSPRDVALDAGGNVYVADSGNHTIRMINPAGEVTTLAGTAGIPGIADGTGTAALFRDPGSVSADSSGNLYIGDTGNHTARRITLAGVVTTLAGTAGSSGDVDGSGSAARFLFPASVSADDGAADGGSRLPVLVNTTSGASALSGKTPIAVAAGDSHSLALCFDNATGAVSLTAWGDNSNGQLGDGTTEIRYLPVDITNSGWLNGKTVIAIAAGQAHSLALCSDNTTGQLSVAAWGANAQGQLGIDSGATPQSTVPVSVDASGSSALNGKTAVAVAAGAFHSLALCSDNVTLAAWGDNSKGQLGVDPGATPQSSIPVLAGASSGSALNGKTVSAVAAGAWHSLALCTDTLTSELSVAAWGENAKGQLGVDPSTTAQSSVPVSVDASAPSALNGQTPAAVAAGASHSLALCASGAVVAWGDHSGGQLGTGVNPSITGQSHVPVPVILAWLSTQDRFTSIARGPMGDHSLAVAGGPESVPEIVVEQPSSNPLEDGVSSVAFGKRALNDYTDKIFTIRNAGTARLTGLTIQITGTDAGDFALVGSGSRPPLDPGASTTFTVRFKPMETGDRTAAIRLSNNDADENPFDVTLNGSGPAAPIKAAMISPADGSTLPSSTVPFTWQASVADPDYPGTVATAYRLLVGSSAGGSNYYNSGQLGSSVLTRTVSNLPASNEDLFVTLQSLVSGVWVSNSYTYTAYTARAVMATPANGSRFNAASPAFTWVPGGGATLYRIYAGSAQGEKDYLDSGDIPGNVTTYTPAAGLLPTNGSPVYLRLLSFVGGIWVHNDYSYESFTPNLPTVTTPTAANVLATEVTLGGKITANGGVQIAESGVVYSLTSTNNNPVIGGPGVSQVTGSATMGVFTLPVTGLVEGESYSFKAYATNSAGSGYTPVASFNTMVALLNYAAGQQISAALPAKITSMGTVLSVSGLPAGMKYDSLTGNLIGRPTKPGTYKVKITVMKPDNTKATVEMTIIIEALPSWALGNFTALISPQSSGGASLTRLGGHLKLTSTASGSCSGSLALGAKKFSFKSQIEGVTAADRGTDPLLASVVIVTNKNDLSQNLNLDLELRPETDAAAPGLTGILTYQTSDFPIEPGWQHVWHAKTNPAFANKARILNVALRNPDSAAGPQGEGFAVIKLSTAGAVTWAVTLADGRKATAAFTASPAGDLPLYAPIPYPGGGAVVALVATTIDNDLIRASGDGNRWIKLPTAAAATDRSYRDGFDLNLEVNGAQHVAPARGLLLFGNPGAGATLDFTLAAGGIDSCEQLGEVDPVDLRAQLLAGNKLAITPSGVVKFSSSLSPTSGACSGSAKLTDTVDAKAVARTLTYSGLYIPDPDDPSASTIRGFFLLPELPITGQSATATQILSGSAIFNR